MLHRRLPLPRPPLKVGSWLRAPSLADCRQQSNHWATFPRFMVLPAGSLNTCTPLLFFMGIFYDLKVVFKCKSLHWACPDFLLLHVFPYTPYYIFFLVCASALLMNILKYWRILLVKANAHNFFTWWKYHDLDFTQDQYGNYRLKVSFSLEFLRNLSIVFEHSASLIILNFILKLYQIYNITSKILQSFSVSLSLICPNVII